LVACGLLPYGRYRNWGDKQAYFTNGAELSNYNNLLDLEIVSNKGDWYQSADEVLSGFIDCGLLAIKYALLLFGIFVLSII